MWRCKNDIGMSSAYANLHRSCWLQVPTTTCREQVRWGCRSVGRTASPTRCTGAAAPLMNEANLSSLPDLLI
jgi:hypothetical protein